MGNFRLLPAITLCVALIPVSAASQTPNGYLRVGIATHRITRDRMDIRVFEGKKTVRLPHFQEIVVIAPAVRGRSLNGLAGRQILVVPSNKHPHEWDVYSDASQAAGAVRPVAFVQRLDASPLLLPDNVFTLRMVLVSTARYRVAVKTESELFRLKAGQALLVLR